MSLRKRLVLTVLGMLVVCLFASVGAIFGALQDWSGDANDDVLSAMGKDFRNEVLTRGSVLEPTGTAGRLWQASAAEGRIPSFFQVRQLDGRVLGTSSFGSVPTLPERLEASERFLKVPGWLVWTSPVTEEGPIVVAAMRTAATDELMGRVTNVAIVSIAVALVVVALLSLRFVRRGLEPLDDISETAAAIGDGDLARRIEGAGTDTDTEVGKLGSALNAMLGQIEAAFRQREESEERLRRFVADASHELRTPIATIRGYAELFRRGAAARPDDLAMAMGRIESESERMGSLVDELLLLARLDQGRPLDREPVELTELAADAVADALTVRSGHRFEVEYDEPVTVTGDAARLRQVLGNLVGNAIRHTPPESLVIVRVSAEGERAIVDVADNGPGLDVEHVFERFYRGEAARAADHGGAGLGLSIVDAVVAAHGGSVSVRSEPGEGVTFRVTLPLRSGPTS
ncbi:HAMP domain-containing histidine kinase [Allokutzneria sp. A3M-2-11 16]|uniref:sensor histidine kinase n=1 Tax=Allokutzneria sp. A3M-2-11 16 TaxID=2962043 RepID=UPI0020B6CAD1|nr:HAMP domain-containing sensor histidine kinase [Allokutzneria sp. A3M-2-11 16]MCP3799113.1 HAMP domain-containing histidine kinase [Allokutzneria sp. A3M-2-11 16]